MGADRPYLIVNPAAGGGRSGRAWPDLRRQVEDALGPIDFALTTNAGHAIELASAAAQDGRDRVIAVGGDGTLNEVVNGVLRARERQPTAEAPTVGFLVGGTGGDFRRSLETPIQGQARHRRPRRSDLQALVEDRRRKIDVGLARFVDSDGQPTERYFVNVLSAGLGGLVDRHVQSAPRALGGTFSYLGAAARALQDCPRAELELTATSVGSAGQDRSETHRFGSYLVAFCNGRFFGGGMPTVPDARLDDGVFDVVSLESASKLALVWAARSLYHRGLVGMAGARYLRGRRFTLDCPEEGARALFLLDVDGEALGRLPLELHVLPAALTLCG